MLDKSVIVVMENTFQRINRTNNGRLDIIDYLAWFEEARRLVPALLRVPMDDVTCSFHKFGKFEGIDLRNCLKAVHEVLDGVSAKEQASNRSNASPPHKSARRAVGPAPTRAFSPADVSTSRLSAPSSSVGSHAVRKIGQWFGVVPPDENRPEKPEPSRPQRYSQDRDGDATYDLAMGMEYDDGALGISKSASTKEEQMITFPEKSQTSKHKKRKPKRHSAVPDDVVILDMFADSGNMPLAFEGRVGGRDGSPVMITDYRAAVSAYRKYIAREKVYKRRHFARLLTSSSEGTVTKYGRTLRAAPTRKDASEEDVKEQLRSLPTFRPRFIPLMTFIQLAVMCAMLFDSFGKNQFAKIGLLSEEKECSTVSGVVPECPTDFAGAPLSTAVQKEVVNVWVGPDPKYLIHFGARFTPCMREDPQITKRLQSQRLSMCGTNGNPCENQDILGGEGFSCCSLLNRDYGMLSQTGCEDAYGGVWLDELSRHRQCADDGSIEQVTLRPCCVGSEGVCQMYTESQCLFYSGVFHADKQLCSEVACLAETCSNIFGDEPEVDIMNPNQLTDYNQGWRFIWPLFMHAGVIHYVLCMLIQWIVGCQIERTAGWLRVALIYFTAGIGGYLVSSIFDPYVVSVGSGPAVFGLLAVLVVELFQSWKIVPKPWWEFSKLVMIIVTAFGIGTLPFIDNLGHISGFIFGIMASIIFLPYITFGKWDYARKRVLLYINVPLLIILTVLALVAFYALKEAELCPWCKKLNCVEYSDGMDCSATN